MNGNAATRTAKAAMAYTYAYTVSGADAIGAATIQIDGVDAASNVGALTEGAVLTITEVPPNVPVVAWPVGLALAALGGLALRRKRER